MNIRPLVSVLALSLAMACHAETPPPVQPVPVQTPLSDAQPVPSSASGPSPEEPAPPAAPPTTVAIDDAHLMGDVNPAKDPLFAPLPTGMGSKTGMYANKEALEALGKMRDAAKADGVTLTVVSAFRSFKDQKRIWENKWNGVTPVEGGKLPTTVPDPVKRARKIMELSSMPGTSRHHWGTDFDLNDLNNSYFASGKGKAVHDWLTAHAAEYGFCQPYSKKGADRPAGYNEEKWHWSYMPVAKPYLAAHGARFKSTDIKGFEGSQTAVEVRATEDYVQGINPACRK